MSFYPKMFAPSAGPGFESYLIQVNPHGDVVCFALDADGRAMSFVAGKALDVIGVPLRSAVPGLVLWRPHGACKLPYPLTGDCRTWADTIAVLNGPANQRRGEALARYDINRNYGGEVARYVACDWGRPRADRYSLTEAGRQADADFLAKEGA